MGSDKNQAASNMTDATKECPFCAETIKAEAILCRYCGSDLRNSDVQENKKTTGRSGCLWLVILIVGVGILAIVLSSIGGTPSKTTTSSRDNTQAYIATPAPSTQRQNFQGRGKDITDDFKTNSDFVIVKMSHHGSSNFIVYLKNAISGNPEELLVNEIGRYNGSRAVLVDTDRHFLDIEADGSWTMEVTDPGYLPQRKSPPYTFNGNGPDTPAVFFLERGRADFNLQHSGESNFIVQLFDVSRSRPEESLANEIGSWQGTESVSVPGGWYMLDIDADGGWSIDVSQ